MSENSTPTRRKKRLITKKNRSAWAVSIILIVLMALRLVAGITRPAAQRTTAVPTAATLSPVVSEQDKAQSALDTFFNLLVEKRYTEAVTYFGGSYDVLAAAYPQDAADESRLLQDECEHSSCLPIHSVTNGQANGADSFTFTVTFAGEDGRLFTQTTADGRQISQFDISVSRQNGRYLVQHLPLNE
ncbi:MAG: hypothetical protein H6667_06310 [Ardenticatenaceae bacterium]|nr:hypothetical protein [Ardenticatenaceae bacterium]MCB9442794.1 hypothetical protein [Ardenticatenaceae bacterium]